MQNKKLKPDLSTGSANLDPISKTRSDKLVQRRFRWQWNIKLLWISVASLVLVLSASAFSYYYHSSQTANTFLSRAELAKDEGRFEEQAKWLSQYSMLRPDDLDAIVNTALAANSAADSAEYDKRFVTIDTARKYLIHAIARLGDKDAEQTAELRQLLIERLLQLGGSWLIEAESQVIQLDAPPQDPDAVKWLARSLVGQTMASMIEDRSNRDVVGKGYWIELAHQKPGEVLIQAIDLNPTDVNLLADLVTLFGSHPEAFDIPNNDKHGRAELRRRVANKTDPIENNLDSRSQLTIYQFEMVSSERDVESDSASKKLAQYADLAFDRLNAIEPVDPDDDTSIPATIELPSEHWDFVLVAEVARNIRGENPELATRYYEVLTRVKLRTIPDSLNEALYLAFGELALSKNDRDNALTIWRQGLENSNPNSLDLLRAIAQFQIDQPQDDPEQIAKTRSAIERFGEAIESESRQLASLSTRTISRADRIAKARQHDSARWQMNVLNAILDAKTGKTQSAIAILDRALDADVDVDVVVRISVALQLATLHQKEGAWDSASAALDEAVKLAPNEVGIRAEAANAWMRSGNRLRGLEQWKIVSRSESIPYKIAAAQAIFNYQLGLPSQFRDFSGVRSTIGKLRQAIADQPAAPNESSDDADQLQLAIRTLDIIELSLPPSGITAEEHFSSTGFSESVADLAKQFPDNKQIQLFAAENAAVADQSDQAFERLAALSGSDSIDVAIARARFQSAKGKFTEACDGLLEFAKSNPSEISRLHRLAASYAVRGGEPIRAYLALTTIPEPNRSLVTLFTIAQLVKQLPPDSSVITESGLSRSGLANRWVEELRQREGPSGTYWRYMEAAQLIEQLLKSPNRIEYDDAKLIKARERVSEINSSRSRWGQAKSLEGQISAIEGKNELAVKQFRQAIEAGDNRLQTRQMLWTQLVVLDRISEAELEMDLAEQMSGQSVDSHSAFRINLALKQGDIERSMELARTTAQQQPNDVTSQIVHAQTAIIAARKATTPTDREELLRESLGAIEKAESVSDGDQLVVFSAWLSYRLETKETELVQNEINRIKESELSEFDRLRLMSRGWVGLKDYEAALPLIIQADKLRPSSNTQLALAAIYRMLEQPNQEIESLRVAQRRSPENAELRNRLAQALATRDGREINWDELSELLQSSDQSTGVNRFLLAILYSVHGDEDQQEQSATILREIIKERNAISNDAARALAGVLRKNIQQTNKESERESIEQRQVDNWMAEIRTIYEMLTGESSPESIDLYRYADFLLLADEPGDRVLIKNLLDRLRLTNDGTLGVLEIAIRLAKKEGRLADSPDLIDQWATSANQEGALDQSDVWAIAGASLVELGFVEDGVELLERGYANDSNQLGGYIFALNKIGETPKAMEICTQHHLEHKDLKSVVLLIETILNLYTNSTTELITEQHRAIVEEAVQTFKDNPALLESVATWRIQDQDYERAVAIYRMIDQLDPKRIRTLNNLAMAYSEIPGSEALGIEPIERAIRLAGKIPELLDTYGVVLLGAGKLKDAENAFREASRKSDEPRFQFHLIVTLQAQKKDLDAKILWKTLDVENLDPLALTVKERQKLEEMKKDFGS